MSKIMNHPVKPILSKLISKNPNEKEVQELKAILDKSSDEEIRSTLDEMWFSYQAESNEYSEEKDRIKKILDEQLNPGKQLKKNHFWLNRFRYSSVAAIFILVFVSILVLISQLEDEKPVEYLAVSTLAGETKLVELPDGSTVKLNANTSMSYPENFNHSNRIVHLDGEAYFKVRKLGNKFIVKAQNHDVEVLGTIFNVKSYMSDNILEVVLLTGKVKISRSKGQSGSVILEPNEKYEYSFQNHQAILSQTNTDEETAWLRGEIVFRNKSLKQVLMNLERFYAVNISTSKLDDIQDDTFNGRFDRGEIKKVLEILAIHYPISYTIHNNDIAISKKQ